MFKLFPSNPTGNQIYRSFQASLAIKRGSRLGVRNLRFALMGPSLAFVIDSAMKFVETMEQLTVGTLISMRMSFGRMEEDASSVVNYEPSVIMNGLVGLTVEHNNDPKKSQWLNIPWLRTTDLADLAQILDIGNGCSFAYLDRNLNESPQGPDVAVPLPYLRVSKITNVDPNMLPLDEIGDTPNDKGADGRVSSK